MFLSVLVTDDGLFVILSFIAGWGAEVVDELTRRLVVHLTQMVLADGHNRHATDHHEDAKSDTTINPTLYDEVVVNGGLRRQSSILLFCCRSSSLVQFLTMLLSSLIDDSEWPLCC